MSIQLPAVPDDATCERIAKRWCELTGLDPNEIVQEHEVLEPIPEIGIAQTVCVHSLRWEIVAREVPAMLAWFRALQEFPP